MASPNITFSSIPSNVRVPGVYMEENTANALSGLAPQSDKLILIAQQLSTGSVASKTPTKVFSDADSALYFGTGSIAHLATRAMFQASPNIDLTVVGVSDNGTTKATGSVLIQNGDTTAHTAGTIDLWIGDAHIGVGVSVGDSTSTVATAVKTALDSVQQYLPLTYSLSTATLALTARNAGTIGNYTTVTSKSTSDMTCTIIDMTGGATDPDVGNYGDAATVLSSIVGGGYTIIASTFENAANLTKIETMVDFVSGPIEQRPAIMVYGYTDQVGNLAAAKASALALNNGRATQAYITYAYDNLAKSEPWKVGCAYAAIIGSQPDPSNSMDNLPVVAVAPPAVQDRFTWAQKQDQLNNGLTPLQVIPGETVAICRAISTYTLNSLGFPDPTLLDITTIRALDMVRFQILVSLSTKFVRAKNNSRVLSRIKAEVKNTLYLLEAAQVVRNVKQYESGILVEQDLSDVSRVDIKVPAPIVPGLHVIAGVIELLF